MASRDLFARPGIIAVLYFLTATLSIATQLTPLEISSEAESVLQGNDESPKSIVSESACMMASDVIKQHSGKYGCIAFAVRRPGEFEIIHGS